MGCCKALFEERNHKNYHINYMMLPKFKIRPDAFTIESLKLFTVSHQTLENWTCKHVEEEMNISDWD